MATLLSLVSNIQKTINGQLLLDTALDHGNIISTISAEDIIGYLNQGVRHIASGIIVPGLNDVTNPLPELFTLGSVTTGTDSYVALPDNYSRDLHFVANASHVELTIYWVFSELARTYTNRTETGSLDVVAIKGSTLHYRKIPVDPEVLTIHYYRKPVDMAIDTDEPDGIPEHLHEALLCNYALIEIVKSLPNVNVSLLELYTTWLAQAIRELDAVTMVDRESSFF